MAALARTDWSQRFDLARLPSLHYASSQGSGQILLSALTDDRTEALSIVIDRKGLGLAEAPRTIDLARETRRVSVSVRIFDRARRQSPSCSREAEPASQAVWRAVNGRMIVEVSRPGITAADPATYRATVRIEAAEFVNAAGRRVRLDTPVTITTRVVQLRVGGF